MFQTFEEISSNDKVGLLHVWVIFSHLNYLFYELSFVVFIFLTSSFFINLLQISILIYIWGISKHQGKKRALFKFEKYFPDFAFCLVRVLHRNINNSSFGNHFLTLGRSYLLNLSLYWSCQIVPFTIYKQPVPLLLIRSNHNLGGMIHTE